jgi:hypothetical protein
MKTTITTLLLLFFVSTAVAQQRIMPENRTVVSFETGTVWNSTHIGTSTQIGLVVPTVEGLGLQIAIPFTTVNEFGPTTHFEVGNPYIGIVTDQNGLSMRFGAFVGGLLNLSELANGEGFWMSAPYGVEAYRGNTSVKATTRYRNTAWEVSPVVEAGITSTLHAPDGQVVAEGLTGHYAIGVWSDAYGIEAEATIRGWTTLRSDNLPGSLHYASIQLGFNSRRFVPTLELLVPVEAARTATVVAGFRYRF